MKSHFGFYSTETSVGKWVDVLCKKKNSFMPENTELVDILYAKKI
jgi:hypothetical protein